MSQKIAFLTGILGQDGAYLAQNLLQKDYKVYGMIRRYTKPNFENTDYLGITNDIEFLTGDMTDESSISNLIKHTRPYEVYNLAAQSFVGVSWDQAKFTTEVNSLGVLHLLNAIKMFSPASRFYQASTSEMYGNSSIAGIQNENTPFHPRSPYAISKLYSYWITNNYKESYGLFCCNGILFNHESPLRGLEFVTRKITNGVARIKLGLDESISLGNINARRDWGFAGDYVEAMWLMMQQENPDNYVIATGENHSVSEFLNIAFEYVGIKDWKKYIKIDPRYNRPADVDALKGISEKAQKNLNWQPKVKLPELVKMMVDADMARLELKVRQHGQLKQSDKRIPAPLSVNS